MRLEPVTPETLTPEQKKPLLHVAIRTDNVSYDMATKSLVALINAEREVGVRSVVEVLRELAKAAGAFTFSAETNDQFFYEENRVRLDTASDAAYELLALYPEQQ